MRPNQMSITRRGRAGVSPARASAGCAQRGPACGGTAAPFADAWEAANNLIHTNNSPNSSPERVCGRLSLDFYQGLSLDEFQRFMAGSQHVLGLFFYRERALDGRR